MFTNMNLIRNLVLTICSLTILIATKATSALRSSYDEHCNKTLRCKSQSWLSCDPETSKCDCARPDEMSFDPARGKCVALIGERCKYGFDEEEEGYGVVNPWYGKAECVEGATCGPSGICSCPTGTYEDNPNKCGPVKNYGEFCLGRSECNQDKFLNCVQGTCKCDPDNAVYTTEEFQQSRYDRHYGTRAFVVPGGTCVGRAGTRCSYQTGKHCVRNSKCDEITGACVCDSEYTETSERLCGLGYGQICSNTAICSDKLRCASEKDKTVRDPYTRAYVPVQNGICQCPHPSYQLYNPASKVCQGYVGSPCDPNDSLSCVEKAICSEKNGLFVCDCAEGYIETADGKCEIEYGFDCNYTSAEILFSKFCDRLANLRCKGGKCSCENEADIYEQNRRQCSTPIGIRCENNEQCVQNSHCKMVTNKKLSGRCTCNAGFDVTRNRICATQVLEMENMTESESKEVLIELLEDALENNINNTQNLSEEDDRNNT